MSLVDGRLHSVPESWGRMKWTFLCRKEKIALFHLATCLQLYECSQTLLVISALWCWSRAFLGFISRDSFFILWISILKNQFWITTLEFLMTTCNEVSVSAKLRECIRMSNYSKMVRIIWWKEASYIIIIFLSWKRSSYYLV